MSGKSKTHVMQTKTHVMVDIETLGTSQDAPILTIGAVVFNPITSEVGERWYRKINVKDYDQLGHLFTPSYDTLLWWMKQKKEPLDEAFFGSDRLPVEVVLKEFSEWLIKLPGTLFMWSQGSDFDLPIISHAFSSFDIVTPWKFWNTRDTRTLYDAADVKLEKAEGFELHHAIGDCLRQIDGVNQAYKKIKR